MEETDTKVINYKPMYYIEEPSPLILGFTFCYFSYHDQPQSTNIKWKIPEINNSQVLNCAQFWVIWWNVIYPTVCCTGSESSLCPMCPHCICYLSVNHLAFLMIRSTITFLLWLCQGTLVLLNNVPKAIHILLITVYCYNSLVFILGNHYCA